MKKKGFITILTILFCVVCILFPLVSVYAVESVTGIDTLFAETLSFIAEYDSGEAYTTKAFLTNRKASYG